MEEKITCFNCSLADCVEPCSFGCDQDFSEDLDKYICDDETLQSRKYSLESYYKNKGHMKDRQRTYLLKNKDRINSYVKAYRLKNRDKINAQRRKHRLLNKNNILGRERKYYLENENKINAR